jgi:hypothetical protein
LQSFFVHCNSSHLKEEKEKESKLIRLEATSPDNFSDKSVGKRYQRLLMLLKPKPMAAPAANVKGGDIHAEMIGITAAARLARASRSRQRSWPAQDSDFDQLEDRKGTRI